MENQTDWEHLKEILPPIEGAGRYNMCLSSQPNQLEGLFLLNDDVSSRNLLVLLPVVLTIV